MPRWRQRTVGWLERYPFVALGIGVVVLGGLGAWEIDRITAARYTVSHGWAAGLIGGAAASLVLAALLTAAARISRGSDGRRLGWVAVLTLVIIVSFIVALRATAPPTTVHTQPYVVTTGIAVAGMTYTATFAVLCVALIAWAAIQLAHRQPSQTSGIGPDAPRSRS